MSKDRDLSKHGSSYEIFMHRAYGTHMPSKPEMQASVMQNLIIAEIASQISGDLVTYYEDQLNKIKLYIGKAIDKYLEKPTTTGRLTNTLRGYKTDLIWAISSDELLIIVYNIIHISNRNKIMAYLN